MVESTIADRVERLEQAEKAAAQRYLNTSGEIADRARDRVVELQTYLASIEETLDAAGF
jgi:hypothetical protein